MRKGFTLIELIVVIALMSIFTGFGYTAYTRNIQTKELDREVDAFVTTLSFVRQKAIGRDLSVDPDCPDFQRYYVRMFPTNNPPMYRRGFQCGTGASVVYTTFGDTNLTSTVYVQPTAPQNIYFYHPFGCTTTTCNAATDTVVILRNPSNAHCKDVTINRLGNVTVGEQYAC